jgi:pyruvate,water dikinase
MLKEISDAERSLVGNKAYNLALMLRAGMPIPEGFCILSTAYFDHAESSDPAEALKEEIASAYRLLGEGPVAVRSSATSEDLANASFAGQQQTFLNIEGNSSLFVAVQNCWRSLSSSQAEAYRQRIRLGLDESKPKMAVIVQRMVPAEAAGVLFSRSPWPWNPNQMLLEASRGLGKKLVSGKITPDRFVLDRNSLEIVERNIASQTGIAALRDEEVQKLGRIGLEIEGIFNEPCDIEWAVQGGKIFILQSRPITTMARDDEVEELRKQEVERLRQLTSAQGTVWSRYNLSEVLPAPLPMTWSILSKSLSGNDGFGMAYRELGFIPGKEVCDQPPIDLICGRSYYNLSKEPRFYFADFPLEHDFQELKSDPSKAFYPEPKVDIKKASSQFWLKFPYYAVKMLQAEFRLRKSREDYDHSLRESTIPNFLNYVEAQRKLNLIEFSDEALLLKLEEWRQQTLFYFAKEGFKATILARFSLINLTKALQKELKGIDKNEVNRLVQNLTSTLDDDPTVQLNLSIWKLAQDEMEMSSFLELFGHRAVGEFELSQPRWREAPDSVAALVEMFKNRTELNLSPAARLAQRIKLQEETEAELRARLGKKWKKIETELEFSRRYLPFREVVKNCLMLGHELLRIGLLELGKRHLSAAEDIFYLEFGELSQLTGGKNFSHEISKRREKRDKLLKIGLPDVIFSDALEQIGDPPMPQEAEVLRGISVCGGVIEGPAIVMESFNLDRVRGRSGYILVCPATDPCWTPLFINASGLVMEQGGVLSHGAIVAREFGIPAVVNVLNATKLIRTGQQLRLDGNRGLIGLLPS